MKITTAQLKKHHDNLCANAWNISIQRGKEYAADEDTLETFRNAALIYGCEPADVARMQMCLKVARLKRGYKKDTVLDLINFTIDYDALSGADKK